jgi:hypothetical protein
LDRFVVSKCDKAVSQGEVIVTLPGGDVLLLEPSSAGIKDTDGDTIDTVEIARNVTEQKKAEAPLNRTLPQQNKAMLENNGRSISSDDALELARRTLSF